MKLTRNKRLDAALMDLLDHGWHVARKTRHLVLVHESGRRLFMPLTTPDKGTTAANYMMLIKKARRETHECSA